MHHRVRHGFTNKGEVIGAGIGPGSNSQYFSLAKISENIKYGLSIEVIDQDNDWFYYAFEEAKDFRRYWKDLNFGFSYSNKIKKNWIVFNLNYSRSLNYQWALEDFSEPYYHAGIDQDSFHLNLKFIRSLF